jgi:hypothetical protein
MKGIKRHILAFEIIPTDNPKTLVFIDASDYYTQPEKPLLEITLPGYSKYFLVNIIASKINTFNSNTIGLTEILNNAKPTDLPDGAYHFRFKVCPYETVFKDKVHFRTVLIEKKLAELYEKLEATDCSKSSDNEILRSIVEIHALIEGAKLVVCHDESKANEFYQLADKLIDRATKKLCKNCS